MPTVRTDDGEDLFYQVDDFRDPWKADTGVPVVMGHARGGNTRFFTGWVPTLSRKYKVVRYDLRGCGQSSVPAEAAEEWTTERFVKDALTIIDHLGAPKVHWVGIGTGAAIGVLLAMDHPDRLKSLTYEGTSTSMWEGISEQYDVLTEKSLWSSENIRTGPKEEVIRETRWALSGPAADEAALEWQVAENAKTPQHVLSKINDMWHPLRRARLEDPEPLAALARIPVPMMWLSGDSNVLCSLHSLHILKQHMPNARVCVVPFAGWSLRLEQADLCAAEVLKFIDSL